MRVRTAPPDRRSALRWHCQAAARVEHLRTEVPEFRSKEALAYPLAGFLALIALAMFSSVRRGPQDLAQYAASLSQDQLRALGFRTKRGTPRVRCPGESTLFRPKHLIDNLESKLKLVPAVFKDA